MPKIINENEDGDWLNDMIIAQPGEIIMFKYEGLPPDVSELSKEFAPEPDVELPKDTKHKFDFIQPPLIIDDSESDCMINCVKEQLGINDIVALAAMGSGKQTIAKRFVTEGTAQKTSIASKYLPKIIPKKYSRLSRPMYGPILKNGTIVMSKTILSGRLLARWIPFIGWGLLAYDAIKIVQCMANCRDEKTNE